MRAFGSCPAWDSISIRILDEPGYSAGLPCVSVSGFAQVFRADGRLFDLTALLVSLAGAFSAISFKTALVRRR
ncbi:UNVERIFIED_ORG: hypothetical protein J2Y81_004731 [Paraburkholderia sediminicola]|nr:hypothetical protein [Paraburkholderia sediminicola]